MSKAAAVEPKSHGSLNLEFSTPNDPNADVLLASLRSTGYSLEGAIGDLVDNSIDAEAKSLGVNLLFDTDKDLWTIEIVDDGVGMDAKTLDQMMRLGSRSEHDLSSDLGAFGLGSDTATLAIGRDKHVLSRVNESELLSAIWDLDIVEQEKQFLMHFGNATTEERQVFEEAFHRAGLDVPEAGTVVRITKGDRVDRKQEDAAREALIKYLGSTYRRFIHPIGPIEMRVNGVEVRPVDPLMRDHDETIVLAEDEFEFTWKDQAGKKRSDVITYTVAHLPDFGGEEVNRGKGIRPENSGFYVLRNGREVLRGSMLNVAKRHPEQARFRAELSFPGTMDSQLGITFLKSSAQLHLSQALRDKIDQVIGPFRRESQRRFKKSRKDATEAVPHEEAARRIAARSKVLRKPEAEQEARFPSKKTTPKKEKSPDDETRSARTPRKSARRALADGADFVAMRLGPTGPFFEPALEGKRIRITYNADHPAYEKLILDNRENRSQIAAIDWLTWSLAAAELREINDENAEFMERMREDFSFNLRQLLQS